MNAHQSTTWRAAYAAARFCGRGSLRAAIYATAYTARRSRQGET